MKKIREQLKLKAEKLEFKTEEHTYHLNNKPLISVSALVDLYKQPFDPDGSITARCAAKKGITPREMADEWKANSKISTDKGTLIHQIFENLLNSQDIAVEDLTQEIALKISLLRITCEELKPYLISTEQKIYSEELGVAGTTDALCLNLNQIDIWDLKTDKKPISIDDNPFNKYFLHPLQNLPGNSYYTYALKMSIYRYILEKEGYKVNTLALLHLKEKEVKEILLPYLKEEVETLLSHYKKRFLETHVH